MKPRASRRGRLSRSAEFERVYRHGRSSANRHLVVYAFPNATSDRPRLGLSVSRKVGGAVERNRVKRLVREAFDAVALQLGAGQDVVVVARPEARELAEREGLKGVAASLGELLDRAGLRTGEERPMAGDSGTAGEPGGQREAGDLGEAGQEGNVGQGGAGDSEEAP